jgi:molybdopterin molybdotransferase
MKPPGGMISFTEALAIVQESVRFLDIQTVPLAVAAGRVLAADVTADADQPPFAKAAMDGFACRRADLPGPLRVVETIAAGAVAAHDVGPGLCARIMTGAPVPAGADCVVKFEDTESLPDGMVRATTAATKTNICQQGEDVRRGDIVVGRGAVLAAPHIAVLATVGCAEVPVARRPRVGVLATGDELVPVEQQPGPGRIRNSNGPQLMVQTRAAGAEAVDLGIARDDAGALAAAIAAGLADCDVLLLSGGVSTGDFDLVPQAMQACGLQILFDSVAMKPGRPTTFAVRPGAWCFGLPGNPVSTFLQFELLVRPLLAGLLGGAQAPRPVKARLAAAVRRRPSQRQTWLPVRVTAGGEAEVVTYHGSAHIHALCRADGFIMLPAGVSVLEKGALVDVRPVPAPH